MKRIDVGIRPYQGCDGLWVNMARAIQMHVFYLRPKRRRRRRNGLPPGRLA